MEILKGEQPVAAEVCELCVFSTNGRNLLQSEGLVEVRHLRVDSNSWFIHSV